LNLNGLNPARALKNIEFRVDSSSWTSAIPIDGSFGDAIESFTLIEDLESRENLIEIKAINNWATKDLRIKP
jgi:hypothetical protein